jgi:hypothetical protein
MPAIKRQVIALVNIRRVGISALLGLRIAVLKSI